jgi:selenide,water dikinase
VLRSIERLDDAGVYQISEEVAIIQTIDFITPIVNDPYSFGQIAAANSISDVYTMGGKPVTAMNVVCFPSQTMDIGILKEILRGGLDKMQEAGVALLGGHSVTDPEMKYGLSVTGVVHPDKLITNSGTRVGDNLVLTKPLGTGIMSTALKSRLIGEEAMAGVTQSMATLNKAAAELMIELGAHACTDVTGFGLVGHASHLVQEGEIGIELDFKAIPFFPAVMELSEKKVYPGGL